MHTLTGSFKVGGVGTLAATINNGSTSYEIRLSQRDQNAQVKLTAAVCGGNYTLNGYAMLVDSDELFGFVFGDAMRTNATGVQVSLLPHVALNVPGAFPCARGPSEDPVLHSMRLMCFGLHRPNSSKVTTRLHRRIHRKRATRRTSSQHATTFPPRTSASGASRITAPTPSAVMRAISQMPHCGIVFEPLLLHRCRGALATWR